MRAQDGSTLSRNSKGRFLLLLLGAALVVGGLMVAFSFAYPWPDIPYWAVDFTVFYAAASALAHGESPYVLANLAQHVPPDSIGPVLSYAYPPLLAEALTPLAALSLETAARLWLAFNLLGLVLAVVLIAAACRWRPRPLVFAALVLGAMLFLPSLYTYLSGQASLWALAWAALATFFASRQRHAANGLAWALAWAKPHPLPFAPLALLLRDRVALAVFAAVSALSLTLAAPFLADWAGAARSTLSANANPQQALNQATMLGALGLLGPWGWIVRILLTLLALVGLVLLARHTGGWKPLTVGQVALGLLAAPYIGRSDTAIVLLPLLIILADRQQPSRWPVMLAVVAWCVPLVCILLRLLLHLDWMLLPLVWGGATQFAMLTAAGVYVGSYVASKPPADNGPRRTTE